MKKTSSKKADRQVSERLSWYSGDGPRIQNRLTQVSRPPQTDPVISARLRRYTR